MELYETLTDLYADSGAYGDPILIATLALMLVGSVMLFVVKLVKKFVFYSIIALVLPNSIGFVGYLDEADTIQETVVERAEEMTEEAREAIEDRELAPLSFGLYGSIAAVAVGLVGMLRLSLRKKGEGKG